MSENTTAMGASTSVPMVSVVIPVFNCARTLPPLLESLRQLDYPEDRYEVVIVDNLSTDGTAQILRQYPWVRLMEERQRQSGEAARNTGIRAAQGDILAFTDGDCRVHPGWLRKLVERFQESNAGAVAGHIAAFEPATPIERLTVKKQLLCQERLLRAKPVPLACTANLAVRRDLMQRLGGVNESTQGADLELCWRLQRELEAKLEYAPQAIIYHKHRSTLAGLFEQTYRYGFTQPDVKAFLPEYAVPPSGVVRHLLELIGALLLALSYPIHRDRDALYEPLFLVVYYSAFTLGKCHRRLSGMLRRA